MPGKSSSSRNAKRGKKKVAPVPKGYHTVTPSLIVDDAKAATAFYVKAFGAKEKERDIGPGGKIWHVGLKIGDSMVMLMDEFPEMGAKSARTLGDSPASIWLYVKDVDAVFKQAVRAGATAVMKPADQFWGDRSGLIEDPFGHTWSIATRKEHFTPRELQKRREAAINALSKGQ